MMDPPLGPEAGNGMDRPRPGRVVAGVAVRRIK
jgi:hypothetical protein